MSSVDVAGLHRLLEAALSSEGACDKFGDLLSAVVASITALAEASSQADAAAAAAKASAAKAAESAQACARDSAAAAIAMSEANTAAATTLRSQASSPKPFAETQGTAASVGEPRPDTELLERAHVEVKELISLLDDSASMQALLEADPAVGEEQLRQGAAANAAQNFAAAAAWFEESYRLKPRITTLLSVANMRLKLHEGAFAAYLYTAILEHPAATAAERQMAGKKLLLAEELLQRPPPQSVPAVAAPSGSDGSAAPPPLIGGGTREPSWLLAAEEGLSTAGAGPRACGHANSSAPSARAKYSRSRRAAWRRHRRRRRRRRRRGRGEACA